MWKSIASEKDKTIIKSRWNLQKAMESIIFLLSTLFKGGGVALTDSRHNRKTPTFQLYGKPLGFPVRPSKLYLRACVTSSLIINYIFALTGRDWDCELEQPPSDPTYLLTGFLNHPLITIQILGNKI